ncbi:MAG: WYL domain-containing protein, partial [Limnobacter sp.]|nr:WYL domain-containing protein [Limnobacter sp.]
AWCHMRNGLRAFSVDSILSAELLDKKARNVAAKHLDEELGSGYGIFSGKKLKWATLLFSPERSRWVATEHWHPKQEGRWTAKEQWQLKLPYADDRELMMDILKHGHHCEVVSPAGLRKKVKQAHIEAANVNL